MVMPRWQEPFDALAQLPSEKDGRGECDPLWSEEKAIKRLDERADGARLQVSWVTFVQDFLYLAHDQHSGESGHVLHRRTLVFPASLLHTTGISSAAANQQCFWADDGQLGSSA